ncbi:hypothetical protein INS49_001423 [Diaporthe citri]|uniref:uncharacterized protein n=1 Tax=Diaporthe citri TaxID=83186 RepID=UPI001C8227AA|nr:uncharacterized protein INS49_001423 [Diaporthe citri]KAG6367238.1 hypothetical protein INS49_001423 [Diaporthe citri]
MDCVAILKGIQQEHSLRACGQIPQAVLPTGAKGDPSWAMHGFCGTPDDHGIPERAWFNLDERCSSANSPTRQPYESSPASRPPGALTGRQMCPGTADHEPGPAKLARDETSRDQHGRQKWRSPGTSARKTVRGDCITRTVTFTCQRRHGSSNETRWVDASTGIRVEFTWLAAYTGDFDI